MKLNDLIFCIVIIFTLTTFNTTAIAKNTHDDIHKILNNLQSFELNQGAIIIATIEKSEINYYTSNATINPSTPFEIGSLSKLFTSLLLAIQHTETPVTLDTQLGDIFKEDSLPKDISEITLKQLSTHSSGLPRLPENLDVNSKNPYDGYTHKNLLQYLNNATLSPEKTFVYSNLGAGLLGVALEKITNENYDTLLNHHIASPLMMKNTYISRSHRNLNTMTQGYHASGKKAPHWTFDALASAGGIISTAEDLVNFLTLQLLACCKNTELEKTISYVQKTQLIKAVQLSQEKHFSSQQSIEMGLGWFIHEKDNDSVFWHNGQTLGFSAFMGFKPSTAKGVVILSNVALSTDEIGMAYLENSLDKLNKLIVNRNQKVPPKIIEQYQGNYSITPQFAVRIFANNHLLFAQATNQPAVKLQMKNATTFVKPNLDLSIEFIPNTDGEFDSLILRQMGQTLKGNKVFDD
ncbi:MAG: serine hydrolase domain-containing protein [Pseudomonadota bacterium]